MKPYCRDYNGEVDVGRTIGGYFLVFFLIVSVGMGFYLHKINDVFWDKYESFRVGCLEAGGYPANLFQFVYIKGHGEGRICVKADGLIEVESK